MKRDASISIYDIERRLNDAAHILILGIFVRRAAVLGWYRLGDARRLARWSR